MIMKLKHNPVLLKWFWYIYSKFETEKRMNNYNKKYFSNVDLRYVKKNYSKNNEKTIWFLLEQNHKNIGDLAIGVANKHIFDVLFPKYEKKYVNEYVYKKYKWYFKKNIKRNDLIVLTGGGSIGNAYKSHEILREYIIKKYSNNIVISMPQTMYYDNSKNGNKAFKKAVKVYSSNKNLWLMARERFTYEKMRENFECKHLYLTPDAVMTLNYSDANVNRKGISLCFRNDIEKNISNSIIAEIKNICKQYDQLIDITDMESEDEFVSIKDRENVVKEKINSFKEKKLVVTDRLHCMIFCAISGTPCIAFSNYNKKIEGCYYWLRNLEYIYYCKSLTDFKLKITEMYNLKNSMYDEKYALKEFKRIFWEIDLEGEQLRWD